MIGGITLILICKNIYVIFASTERYYVTLQRSKFEISCIINYSNKCLLSSNAMKINNYKVNILSTRMDAVSFWMIPRFTEKTLDSYVN